MHSSQDAQWEILQLCVNPRGGCTAGISPAESLPLCALQVIRYAKHEFVKEEDQVIAIAICIAQLCTVCRQLGIVLMERGKLHKQLKIDFAESVNHGRQRFPVNEPEYVNQKEKRVRETIDAAVGKVLLLDLSNGDWGIRKKDEERKWGEENRVLNRLELLCDHPDPVIRAWVKAKWRRAVVEFKPRTHLSLAAHSARNILVVCVPGQTSRMRTLRVFDELTAAKATMGLAWDDPENLKVVEQSHFPVPGFKKLDNKENLVAFTIRGNIKKSRKPRCMPVITSNLKRDKVSTIQPKEGHIFTVERAQLNQPAETSTTEQQPQPADHQSVHHATPLQPVEPSDPQDDMDISFGLADMSIDTDDSKEKCDESSGEEEEDVEEALLPSVPSVWHGGC
ncbi:hypothetical protein Bbelb_282980 [Branchiostoma belcheri]|nr:hypothetical protein Bbelb_282980 [Branchiostoma belcheri]